MEPCWPWCHGTGNSKVGQRWAKMEPKTEAKLVTTGAKLKLEDVLERV